MGCLAVALGASDWTLNAGGAAAETESMSSLIERVRSPGGTTTAAFEVLDAADARGIFSEAIDAAERRAAELAESIEDDEVRELLKMDDAALAAEAELRARWQPVVAAVREGAHRSDRRMVRPFDRPDRWFNTLEGWTWIGCYGGYYLQADNVAAAGFEHGFFTRLWHGRDPEELTGYISVGTSVHRPQQVHSGRVLEASQACGAPWPEADGLVSDRGGQSLWVC